MDTFATLACPNCGANLQITPDIDRFACMHCGTQQVVKRSGGIIALQPVVDGLARVQQGTDKTAAELAIRRLTDELTIARAEEMAAKEAVTRYETGHELPQSPVKLSSPSTMEVILFWLCAAVAAIAFSAAFNGAPTSTSLICSTVLIAPLAILYWIARKRRLNKEQKALEASLQAYADTVQSHQIALEEKRSAARAKSGRVIELQNALERNRQIANS